MASKTSYTASNYGTKEVEFQRIFRIHLEDSRNYFLTVIKPRLDRSYKLYIAYNGDRQREIKKWQANIFVPYIMSVVETMMPRILDARPEFGVIGRNEKSQAKAEKQQQLADYFWEISGMDATTEDHVRAALIYGTSFLQVSWKKDVRKLKFLKTKDIGNKKYAWKEEERVFYDAPFCEWVDNYSLWYDWHNTNRKSKQYWLKRLVLTASEIKRRYPMANKERLTLAMTLPGGDLTDYASIRQQVKSTHTSTVKGAGANSIGSGYGEEKFSSVGQEMKMYEVFEYTRPFEDAYAVVVGASYVPIFSGAEMPIPFDFKEAPFIETPYLKVPGEFEGYGLPLILENPQIMLNLVKNQRLDSATLSIHKMWVVNPLANINKDELVTRPFGIIYSIDPNGVREIQFSDVKASAYKEEEMLKSDMRYSSGVDDFSMGAGGGASSATEVRHLRESTLERVRLFVNHLGETYSEVLRYWMDMTRQLFSEPMTIRILGEDGQEMFPLIEQDDLMGQFDYRASVLPSIAGQADVKKKQDMDLFQLLINLPFVDPQKLTSRVVSDWGWSLGSITKAEGPEQPGMGGMPPGVEQGQPGAEQGMSPEQAAALGAPQGGQMGMPPPSEAAPTGAPTGIPAGVLQQALSMLRGPGEEQNPSQFSQASSPIDLLRAGGLPPTVRGIPSAGKTTNPRGHNRGGKVNTTVGQKNTSTESNLLNRAFSV